VTWHLFEIQDESPAFVVANALDEAIRRWRDMVNEDLPEDDRLGEDDYPAGVKFMGTDCTPLLLPHPAALDRVLRFPEVIRITGQSRATLYRRMEDGSFPRPDRLREKGAVGWKSSVVRAWMEARP
jgi:prophage regulatory protein